MPEQLPMAVYRFFTDYVPDPNKPGQKKAVDKVEFGPIGSNGRSTTIERVSRLSKIKEDSGQNPACAMSKAIWAFIEPRYEAWKKGRELPETGTPLASWNLLSPEQIDVLRSAGARTVEQVAALTDTHITRIPIPDLRDIIRQAKLFLEAQDANKMAAEMEKKDRLIADLAAKVDQLAGQVAAQTEPQKRAPGRPKKHIEQPQAA